MSQKTIQAASTDFVDLYFANLLVYIVFREYAPWFYVFSVVEANVNFLNIAVRSTH